jgi:hypothetical protein
LTEVLSILVRLPVVRTCSPFIALPAAHSATCECTGSSTPAIYVVSKDGVITFAHSNPDYRQRLDAKDLLKEISK